MFSIVFPSISHQLIFQSVQRYHLSALRPFGPRYCTFPNQITFLGFLSIDFDADVKTLMNLLVFYYFFITGTFSPFLCGFSLDHEPSFLFCCVIPPALPAVPLTRSVFFAVLTLEQLWYGWFSGLQIRDLSYCIRTSKPWGCANRRTELLRTRSRLYRSRFLRAHTHFTAFF